MVLQPTGALKRQVEREREMKRDGENMEVWERVKGSRCIRDRQNAGCDM